MSTLRSAPPGRLLRLGVLPLLLALAACDATDAPALGDAAAPVTEAEALALLDAFEADPLFSAPFPEGPAPEREDLVCRGAHGAITVDNVIVPDGARCRLTGTQVGGNIQVGSNAILVARGVDVEGNIQTQGHAGVLVRDRNGHRSFVDGDVQLEQGDRAGVGRTDIGGNLQAEQNDGRMLFALNRIGGNLQAFDNTGGLRILRNRIEGALQCQGNNPPPTGGGNQAGDKEGQCANL